MSLVTRFLLLCPVLSFFARATGPTHLLHSISVPPLSPRVYRLDHHPVCCTSHRTPHELMQLTQQRVLRLINNIILTYLYLYYT